MTTSQIYEKLMTDDDFVLAEFRRLQYLYGLKQEIRYAQQRHEEIRTESVAEHVYGMHIIATYFLALEDQEHALHHDRVRELITWHDIGEIATGDMLGQLKTAADIAKDREGNALVIAELPEILKPHVSALLDEYEEQQTPEAQFAKAIDKIEVIFEYFDENYKVVFARNQTTKEQHYKTKLPYIGNYPVIQRFCNVISRELEAGDFFVG